MLNSTPKRTPKTTKGRGVREAPKTPLRRLIIPRPDVLHTYLEYKQVNQYLEYLANRYPNFVQMYTLGLTHEKREVRALEINWMNSENTELSAPLREMSPPPFEESPTGRNHVPVVVQGTNSRNIVFIEAGTHAREWITISTALNCIYQLTERYTRNVDVLRKLRFFIVPLVNPDGYEYSRNKNSSWRKNRRPQKSSRFVGTDCNRNYDIFWASGPTKGNRNTFKGERPFSEPETRSMRNILDRLSPNLLFFLSLHSYGQSIMYPWGYCRDATFHWRELSSLANSGRNAIKSYNGREYRTGSISCLTKRTIAGNVVDYVYGVLRIPMALVMELPARDLGFQPPVEMVSQIGHESWYGIREMCKRSYDLRYQINRNNEPQLPRPPRFVPEESNIDGTIHEAFLRASIEETRAAGGGDHAKPSPLNTPQKTPQKTSQKPAQKTKKRVKRTLRAQHESILRMQENAKRSARPNKLTSASKKMPPGPQKLLPGLFPRQVATSAPLRSGRNRDRHAAGDAESLVKQNDPRASGPIPLDLIL